MARTPRQQGTENREQGAGPAPKRKRGSPYFKLFAAVYHDCWRKHFTHDPAVLPPPMRRRCIAAFTQVVQADVLSRLGKPAGRDFKAAVDRARTHCGGTWQQQLAVSCQRLEAGIRAYAASKRTDPTKPRAFDNWLDTMAFKWIDAAAKSAPARPKAAGPRPTSAELDALRIALRDLLARLGAHMTGPLRAPRPVADGNAAVSRWATNCVGAAKAVLADLPPATRDLLAHEIDARAASPRRDARWYFHAATFLAACVGSPVPCSPSGFRRGRPQPAPSPGDHSHAD